MLKVIKKDVPTHSSAPAGECWALVRTSSKDAWASMRLPFTIGFHPDNDIYVNAPTMRQISKVIASQAVGLVVIDAQSHAVSDIVDLKLFGIEVLGPFQQDPATLSSLSRGISMLLGQEKAVYSRKYPAFLRSILPRSQKMRLYTIAATSIFCVWAISVQMEASDTVQDLSERPIAATMGNVVELGIKSPNGTNSYSKGATIKFAASELTTSKQFVLTLGLSGLDIVDELSIELNGKLVGKTSPQLNCIDAYCNKDFAVDANLVNADGNVLTIRHNAPTSSYFVKNVYFRSMEPATDEDRELIHQLLASAERYYEERLLLTQNIKNASDAVQQVESMIGTRTGIESIKPRFALVKKKVAEGFKDTSSDLQFKLQKELKLGAGHRKPAIALINELLKLYPDPASRQYMMLVQQKKLLQESEK